MKTTLVIPDLQIPLEDWRFVEKLLTLAVYVQPDTLAFAGDLTDSTEVGRWVKGKHGEYAGKLQEAFDRAAEVVGMFRRAVGDGVEMILVESNHDERLEKYIVDNAPALSSLRSLDLSSLLGLDDHGVSLVRGPFRIAPETVLIHSHERAYSSVQGKWGLDRIKDYDMNVVYGHTHTPCLVTSTIGTKETSRTRWAMNVGHGMDKSKAGYLGDGYATWNQAFGLVHEQDGVAYPELIVANNGRFQFDGKVW